MKTLMKDILTHTPSSAKAIILYKTSESSSIHNAVSENKLGQMNIDSTVTEENQEDFFITFSTKEEAIKKVERATFIENENLTENLHS